MACPSVCQLPTFLRIGSLIFALILCMVVGVHGLKTVRARFFRKSSVSPFSGKRHTNRPNNRLYSVQTISKCTKTDIFHFGRKLAHRFDLGFSMEVDPNEGFKRTLISFCGKICILRFQVQKMKIGIWDHFWGVQNTWWLKVMEIAR